MTPRKDGPKPGKRESRVLTLRFGVRVGMAGVLIVAALYGWHRTEQFLIKDPRFAVALPDYGLESPSLQITGLQYASRPRVLRVFAPDYGRSLYLLPIKQRREQLLALGWIKDASVARLWPNRVVVQIQERIPVAFLQQPGENPRLSEFSLIDADGVILQPPPHAKFNLPVARGMRSEASLEDRRNQVRRLIALMKEIGPLGDRISEIDVADLDNIKVTASAGQRAVVLMLGDHNFAKRIQNFVNHYSKIQERLSNATTLDMRLEDRITVVEGGQQ
jgi:cell division protein FtsQ